MRALAGLVGPELRPGGIASVSAALDHMTGRALKGSASIYSDDRVVLGVRGPEASNRETAGALTRHGPGILRSARRDVVLAGDIRLDHRTAAEKRWSAPPDLSDLALFATAYLADGTAALDHLHGAFAVAIWDVAAATLTLIRDHYGLKPLVYSTQTGGTAFASEVTALTGTGLAAAQIDTIRVADFLARRDDDEERTFYTSVRRLPRGHYLAAGSTGSRRVIRYYSIPFDAPFEGDDEAASGQLLHTLRAAVGSQLRHRGPVGSTLSGGLDSSAVTGLARLEVAEQGRGPLHAFSVIFPGLPGALLPSIDERSFMLDVASLPGIRHHELFGDRLTPLDGIEQVLAAQGEPFQAPNAYLDHALYSAAQEAGVAVLLDGIEGDLVMTHGQDVLSRMARQGRWSELSDALQALAARSGRPIGWLFARYGAPEIRARFGSGAWIKAGCDVRDAAAAMTGVGLSEVLRCVQKAGGLKPGDQSALLKPSFQQSSGLVDRLRVDRERSNQAPRSVHEAHVRLLSSGHAVSILEFIERNASAHGIEARHPMFDRAFVELCVSFTGEQRLADGYSRVALRRALKGIVPESVRWRTHKASLHANFQYQLEHRAMDQLAQIVDFGLQRLGHLVDEGQIRRHFFARNFAKIWNFVVLSVWTEKHVARL